MCVIIYNFAVREQYIYIYISYNINIKYYYYNIYNIYTSFFMHDNIYSNNYNIYYSYRSHVTCNS
jgi:hypothetical protein